MYNMTSSVNYCKCPIKAGGASIVNSPVCGASFLFMVYLEAYLRARCDISTPCSNPVSENELPDEYDFIVVGAGAAGPIVASRLTENTPYKVLLLEAGGPEPIGSKVPSFYRAFWSNKEVDWNYRTVKANYCLDQHGKGCLWPRGKVLGGCTVLNGMIFHRGHESDYNSWVTAGAEGWSMKDNMPYFYMNEGNKQIGSMVSQKHHSNKGPMPIQQFNYQPPMVYEFLKAINESGYPVISDMNDPNTPAGFTIVQAYNADGQRVTTARAYLKPKSVRPNLSLKLYARVTKVLFKGKRTVGVELINKSGKMVIVRASKEVILCAGALNTPHILLLSGVGPRKSLESFGIPVVADLPVGRNLRNHVGVVLSFLMPNVPNKETLNWVVANDYLTNRQGPMSATGLTQLTGIMYSSLAKSRKQPDLQFFFNGYYAECSKTGAVDEPGLCSRGFNVSSNVVSLLPRSIGQITLRSKDPLDEPLFDPNFFSHPDDMIMIKDGVRILKKIFDNKILKKKYGLKLDLQLSCHCKNSGKRWSDKWLECMIRYHTDPQNHQLGTASIGKVIDKRLRVYNVSGLRVIDASSLPTQPSGNPQGVIMMLAERGAKNILEEYAMRQIPIN